MKYNLEKLDNLVDAFGSLPTVGKKSALRFAYHIILKDPYAGLKLAHAIENAIKNVKKCDICGGLSENEICDICLDENRNSNILCLVQDAKDMLILEQNGSFDGFYFVLENLNEDTIFKLEKIIQDNDVREIIFALTPGFSSDGIMLFIEDKLSSYDINFTKIAQGVPTGVNLENVDNLSLSKALQSRIKI